MKISDYTGQHSPADVRAWAIKQGTVLAARGTLPADVVQAYAKAHRLRRRPAKAAA